jgi:hypothetical protein
MLPATFTHYSSVASTANVYNGNYQATNFFSNAGQSKRSRPINEDIMMVENNGGQLISNNKMTNEVCF